MELVLKEILLFKHVDLLETFLEQLMSSPENQRARPSFYTAVMFIDVGNVKQTNHHHHRPRKNMPNGTYLFIWSHFFIDVRSSVQKQKSILYYYQCTQSFPDEVELVNVRLPRPEWTPTEQLGEDTPQRPHVHGRSVLRVPNQELRSPVPAGRYVVCVVVLGSC